jgi:membrane-bound metal-dependent hydrolase YbcI (DUF457 family)
MITTGHLFVGGAIGLAATTLSSSPWAVPVALLAGVASHHLLDLLPHTDAATFWPDERKVPLAAVALVVLESMFGVGVTGTLLAAQHTTWAFGAGALGGVLPDLLDEIPLWQHRFRRSRLGALWHDLHLRLHCADMTMYWRMGLVIDGVVVVGSLWLLLAMR